MRLNLHELHTLKAFKVGGNSKMLCWGDTLNLTHAEGHELHLNLTKTIDNEIFAKFYWVATEPTASFRKALESIAIELGLEGELEPFQLVNMVAELKHRMDGLDK
jgi:hypothetical protein